MKDRITGTKEWATSNVNLVTGCAHGCWYCYARSMAARFGRRLADRWCEEVVRTAEVSKRRGKRKGRIMLPSTHDITEATYPAVREVLVKLLSAGNEVLVVSKPHEAIVAQMCRDLFAWQDQVLFRFTIGTMERDSAHLFEPGAPTPKERLACLREAHCAGYQTSASCEPLLVHDTFQARQLIESLRPHVTDSIWIGLMNNAGTILKTNGAPPAVVGAARLLHESWSRKNVMKLHSEFADDPLVKWKDSIKKIVGLDKPTEAGLDI